MLTLKIDVDGTKKAMRFTANMSISEGNYKKNFC